MTRERVRRSTPNKPSIAFGRSLIAALLFLLGSYGILSCYGNAVVLPDTPLLTTRGDAAVSLVQLQRLAAQGLQAQSSGTLPAESLAGKRHAAAVHLLSQEPLSADALVLAYGGGTRSAERDLARPLVMEAMRRDPRSRGARAWQIVDAAMSRRFPSAMRNFERLLSIAPGDSEMAVPLITLLINDPDARQALLTSLDQPRSWHARLAGEVARSHLPTQVIDQFAIALLRHPDPSTRQSMLGVLVNRGAYARAYELWRDQLPAQHRPAHPQVNATNFSSFAGSYPFAWMLTQEGSDGAVPLDGGGVEIRYSGQRALTFAAQMLVMPPGRYSLVVGGEQPLKAEGLEWQLRCASNSSLLGGIDLGALSVGQTRASAEIAIPSSCTAQTLSLTGKAALFPAEKIITIGSVDLIR